MSIMTSGGSIKPMPGYEDTINAQEVRQGSEFNDLINEFLDNREVDI